MEQSSRPLLPTAPHPALIVLDASQMWAWNQGLGTWSAQAQVLSLPCSILT